MTPSSRFPTFALAALALAAALAAAFGASGCGSADGGKTGEAESTAPPAQEGGGEAEGDAVASESDIRASCANPRRYFATFRSGATGACVPVDGKRGQWVPEQPFPTAPARVQAAACGYRWSSSTNAAPERDLLAAKIGKGGSLAPACGKGAQPAVGRVTQLPFHFKIIGGTVGCDVCGLVADGTLYVVLPADRVAIEQVEIAMPNGPMATFQIEPDPARALRIPLPASSDGASYAEGPVAIH